MVPPVTGSATQWHVLLDDLPRQARAVVRVTGEDATRFLQGLLSADVGELTSGVATPATLLTVKGKIVSELWVLGVEAADDPGAEVEPWLAIPADTAEAVVAHLDAHIIMDDVELEVLEGWAGLLQWPAGESGAPAQLRSFTCTHPLPGRLLLGPRGALEAARATLAGEPGDAATFTRARIAHGRPAWGFEIVPDYFPPEVGFVDAVSYDKGCFLGQEPLSRIHNRGHVNRVMVRVQAAALPVGEGPVALSAGEVEVGRWTSWAPVESGPEAVIGLAIVKRAQAKPGTVLQAGEIAVEVTSGPLGDDPGGPGRQKTGTVTLGGRR